MSLRAPAAPRGLPSRTRWWRRALWRSFFARSVHVCTMSWLRERSSTPRASLAASACATYVPPTSPSPALERSSSVSTLLWASPSATSRAPPALSLFHDKSRERRVGASLSMLPTAAAPFSPAPTRDISSRSREVSNLAASASARTPRSPRGLPHTESLSSAAGKSRAPRSLASARAPRHVTPQRDTFSSRMCAHRRSEWARRSTCASPMWLPERSSTRRWKFAGVMRQRRSASTAKASILVCDTSRVTLPRS
mmetsp:Transcript_9726/g.31644  ORF Transcript_9726/g.31644 Transcript_9726/m.31644 type:complete len:253 (-) Transcript_9726:293-1051(-)